MPSLRNVFAAAAISLFSSMSVLAQARVQFVEYSAKFLCGVVEAEAPGSAAVRPGIYETSINIHNPQLPTQLPPVSFVKKAVLALPEGDKPIPPSAFRLDSLQADFAEQVDCRVIRSLLGQVGAAPFIEGYLVLFVIPDPLTAPPRELDVTGVYTVNASLQSIGLEMVPVAPRLITLSLPAGTKMRDRLMQHSKPQ